jgi:hypothetical protein
MLHPMTPERFAVIRRGVMQRRMDKLAAEIAAATDWDRQAHFDVDEFLECADSFVEQSEMPPRRSTKRPRKDVGDLPGRSPEALTTI